MKRSIVWLASVLLLSAVIVAIGTLPGLVVKAHGMTVKRVLPVGTAYPPAVERWRPLVCRFFPHVNGFVPRRLQQEALAIIWCESGGNTRCVTGSCAGLFQIHSKAHGYSIRTLKNAVRNVRIAARLYVTQGYRWRPAWTTARRLRLR